MLTSPSGLLIKNLLRMWESNPHLAETAVLPLGLALLDLKLIPSLFFSEIVGEEAYPSHPTEYVC